MGLNKCPCRILYLQYLQLKNKYHLPIEIQLYNFRGQVLHAEINLYGRALLPDRNREFSY
jgi:hypothetical protein